VPAAAEQVPAAAQQAEQVPAAAEQAEQVPAAAEQAEQVPAEPVPIQIVVPDEPEFLTQPPKKIPVKRNTSKVHCSEFNSIFTAQISVTDCSTCVNFLSQNS
jgi:hypothetical protein